MQPAKRTVVPSQTAPQGAEPLLVAATDPAAESGAYYGPSRWGGLVGPPVRVKLPRSARGADLASAVWAIGENLTGAVLPADPR